MVWLLHTLRLHYNMYLVHYCILIFSTYSSLGVFLIFEFSHLISSPVTMYVHMDVIGGDMHNRKAVPSLVISCSLLTNLSTEVPNSWIYFS